MAKKAAFGIVRVDTTPQVVGQLRNWTQPNESNEIDATVMGTGNATMIPGSKREDLECDLFWAYADAGQAFILANLGSDTAVPVELLPEGAGTGLPIWTANAYVMNATPQGAADGAIEMNGVRFVSDDAGGTWSAQ